MSDEYDVLKLGNQLCFPLYACSKEITKAYKPYLDQLNLTYTQYITMMVLWEHKEMNVKCLGDLLYLDSGTLTPLLKKLEQRGYLTRTRDTKDERVVIVSITPEGEALKEIAVGIPKEMGSCLAITQGEAGELYSLLYKILHHLQDKK